MIAHGIDKYTSINSDRDKETCWSISVSRTVAGNGMEMRGASLSECNSIETAGRGSNGRPGNLLDLFDAENLGEERY